MMMTDLGHWETKLDIPEDAFGFIYIITTPKGQKYLGKKQMNKIIRRPPLKGFKRKRICVVPSDWKTYGSSGSTIMADIKENGEEGYKFEIIRVCSCKWGLAYFEAKEQFDRNVLFENEYLNGMINLRISSAPRKLQEKYDNGELK